MAVKYCKQITTGQVPEGQLVAEVAFVNDQGVVTPIGGGSSEPYVLPAASAQALGGVKLAAAVADVAAPDATSTASTETVDPTEFAAVVTELNETKQKLNAALAALRASGALASA